MRGGRGGGRWRIDPQFFYHFFEGCSLVSCLLQPSFRGWLFVHGLLFEVITQNEIPPIFLPLFWGLFSRLLLASAFFPRLIICPWSLVWGHHTKWNKCAGVLNCAPQLQSNCHKTHPCQKPQLFELDITTTSSFTFPQAVRPLESTANSLVQLRVPTILQRQDRLCF